MALSSNRSRKRHRNNKTELCTFDEQPSTCFSTQTIASSTRYLQTQRQLPRHQFIGSRPTMSSSGLGLGVISGNRSFMVHNFPSEFKLIVVNPEDYEDLCANSLFLRELFSIEPNITLQVFGVPYHDVEVFIRSILTSNDATSVKTDHLSILTRLASKYGLKDLLTDLIMYPKNFKKLDKFELLREAEKQELNSLMNRVEQELINSPDKVYHKQYLTYLELAREFDLNNLKNAVEAHLFIDIEDGIFKGWNTLENYMDWTRDNGVILYEYETALENFLASDFETKSKKEDVTDFAKYLHAAKDYAFAKLWVVVEKYLMDKIQANKDNRTVIEKILEDTNDYDIKSIKDTISQIYIDHFMNNPNISFLNTAYKYNLKLVKDFIADFLGTGQNFENHRADIEQLDPRAKNFAFMHMPK